MVQDLFDLAESLGVRIEYADLSHLDRDGDCNIDERVIRLQEGMLERLERSVLCHELAHFIRGDRRTMFGVYDERDERRADEWAAHYLIAMIDFEHAELKFGNNVEAIAQELNVMDYIVEAYMRTLDRLGDYLYAFARMGDGQWAKKVAVA